MLETADSLLSTACADLCIWDTSNNYRLLRRIDIIDERNSRSQLLKLDHLCAFKSFGRNQALTVFHPKSLRERVEFGLSTIRVDAKFVFYWAEASRLVAGRTNSLSTASLEDFPARLLEVQLMPFKANDCFTAVVAN